LPRVIQGRRRPGIDASGFRIYALRPYREKLAFHNIFEIIEAIENMEEDNNAVYIVRINHESCNLNSKDINELIPVFEDNFQGAYEIVEECYDLPEFLRKLISTMKSLTANC